MTNDLSGRTPSSEPCPVCGTRTPEVVYSHDGQAHDDAGVAAYERDRAKKSGAAVKNDPAGPS